MISKSRKFLVIYVKIKNILNIEIRILAIDLKITLSLTLTNTKVMNTNVHNYLNVNNKKKILTVELIIMGFCNQ